MDNVFIATATRIYTEQFEPGAEVTVDTVAVTTTLAAAESALTGCVPFEAQARSTWRR